MTTNAKLEFIEEVAESGRPVKCAFVECMGNSCILKVSHTKKEYEAFLESLDFEYDSGWGCQELYGCIWYTDDTWSSRVEYDGSEWWSFNCVPTVGDEML